MESSGELDFLYIDTNNDTGKMDCETSLFSDSNSSSTGSVYPCLSPISVQETTEVYPQANLKSVISRKRSSSSLKYHDAKGRGNTPRSRAKEPITHDLPPSPRGFKRHSTAPHRHTNQIHKQSRETSKKRKIMPLQDLKFDKIPFPNRDTEQKFEQFLERLDSFEEPSKASRIPNFHKTQLSTKFSRRHQVTPLLDIDTKQFDASRLGTSFDKRNNIVYHDKPLPPHRDDNKCHQHKRNVRNERLEHTVGRTQHPESLDGRIDSVVTMVAESSKNMHPSCSEYQKIVENLESLICDMVPKSDGVKDFKSKEPSKNSFLTKAGMFTDGSERNSRSPSNFVRKLFQMADREENLTWQVLEALEMIFLKTHSNHRNCLTLTNCPSQFPHLKRSSHQFSKELSESFCSEHCLASSSKTYSRKHSYGCECQELSNYQKDYIQSHCCACPEHKRRKY